MLELPTFFQKEILLEFWLEKPAFVTIKLFDYQENCIDLIIENQHLAIGKQKIIMTKTNLKKGKYIAKIYIKNFDENITETQTVSVE